MLKRLREQGKWRLVDEETPSIDYPWLKYLSEVRVTLTNKPLSTVEEPFVTHQVPLCGGRPNRQPNGLIASGHPPRTRGGIPLSDIFDAPTKWLCRALLKQLPWP